MRSEGMLRSLVKRIKISVKSNADILLNLKNQEFNFEKRMIIIEKRIIKRSELN